MYGNSASIIKYLLVVTILFFAGLGNAAFLDQIQSDDSFGVGGFVELNNNGGLKQSFQPLKSSNIAGAGLRLNASSRGSGNITIELFDGYMNSLASGSKSGTAAAINGDWVDVFWSPELVNSADTLYLVSTSIQTDISISTNIFAGGAYSAANEKGQ
jgi:hypothetical protein